MNLNRSLRLLVLLALPSSPADAQSIARPDPLFKTIQSLDTELFDAYNYCDLTTLGAMVSDDLEFYHDQTGLSVGKAPFLAAIKQNICGKVEHVLLQDTLEVCPLKGYGAVEIGVHRFTTPRTRAMVWEMPSCDAMAEQGWCMEGDARDQLQPQPGIVGEVGAAIRRS
jgi:hypothetical protein